MSGNRWRIEAFRKNEDVPFVSNLVFVDRYEQALPAVMSDLSLAAQIAAEDERVDRIEIRRQS